MSVVRAGMSLADACQETGSEPSPTPSPSGGANPSESTEPAEGGNASTSPDGGQAGAAPNTIEGGQQAFDGNNTCDPNGSPQSATGRSDLELPSTDTMLRTGGTVAGMAVPALAGGLVSILAFVLGRRRATAGGPDDLGIGDGHDSPEAD
jgi:hypothetical protein